MREHLDKVGVLLTLPSQCVPPRPCWRIAAISLYTLLRLLDVRCGAMHNHARRACLIIMIDTSGDLGWPWLLLGLTLVSIFRS